MKKIPAILLLLCAIPAGLSGQTYEEWLKEDASRAAYVYHNYEPGEDALTPAPAGFKPFYISHYGRHGSRYHTSESFFKRCIPCLEQCSEAKLLTAKGEEMLADLKVLQNEHEGMYGFLTQTGSEEHKGIAERMYLNFPEVFSQKGRKQVICTSSPIQRCIQSMANFTISLGAQTRNLDFHYYTGDRFFSILANSVPDSGYKEVSIRVRDSLVNANFCPDRLVKETFTDKEAAAAIAEGGFEHLFLDVFLCACIAQDLETVSKDAFKYFNFDELCALSYAENTRIYAGCYINNEIGDVRARGTAEPLLKDILEKADAAVAGNDRAADLRFGHDSGLAPLLSFIGFDGNDWIGPVGESSDHWLCWREMCMGSNLQIVFYHNRKGEVLVKFLHNEAETTIAAVPAYKGPYYRWTDIRAYFEELLKD